MSSVWTARGMPALLAATFLGFSGFSVLMPVVPLWVVRGGADERGAGLVNGVLLLVTVLTQFTVPGLLRRFGWGPALAAEDDPPAVGPAHGAHPQRLCPRGGHRLWGTVGEAIQLQGVVAQRHGGVEQKRRD